MIIVKLRRFDGLQGGAASPDAFSKALELLGSDPNVPMSLEVLRAVLKHNEPQFEGCLSPALLKKIGVKFTISPTGAVSSAEEFKAGSFPTASTRACVLAVVRKMSFPKPSADLKVEIRLNLDLNDWHEFEVKVVHSIGK